MTMTVPEILDELTSYTGEFPQEAVEAAVERREEIVPELLRILDEAIEDPEALLDPDFMGHEYALHLLAQFREPAAYPRLLRLVRLPPDVVDAALGDTVTEGLPRMLAALARGDATSIRALVEDREVCEWVRGSAVVALEEMALAGDLSREEVVEYLGELLEGRLEQEYSNVWDTVVASASHLHATELEGSIRRAYDEGLVDPRFIPLEGVEEDFRQDREVILERSRRGRMGPIEDTVAEMSWWACFDERYRGLSPAPDEAPPDLGRSAPPAGGLPPWPEPYVHDAPKVGRNDPCPCGSGKKYKKCCLRLDREAGVPASQAGAVRRAGAQSQEWQVDVVPVPGWIPGVPEARPSLLVVVAGGVMIHSVTLDRVSPEPEELAAVLAEGVRGAEERLGRLPERLLVGEEAVAEAVASHFGPRMGEDGTLVGAPRVEASPLLELRRVAYDLLSRTEEEPPPPGLGVMVQTWAAWGLPDDLVARIFRAAASFHRAAPWELASTGDALDAVAPSGNGWAVVVLGPEGDGKPGVGLFSDATDLVRLDTAFDPDAVMNDLRGRLVELLFHPSIELPPAMRREIRSSGWEVADPEALPEISAINTPAGGVRRSDAEDLVALLEALPRWAREHREVFEEAEEGDLLPPVTWRDETTGVEISWPLEAWYEDEGVFDDPSDEIDDFFGGGPVGFGDGGLDFAYDPEVGPIPEEWLALGEFERLDAVEEAHERELDDLEEESASSSARAHAIMHTVVENQLADNDPPETAVKLEELMAGGLSRHEAVHAVGSVVAGLLWELGSGRVADGEDPTARYLAELERLTVESWRKTR